MSVTLTVEDEQAVTFASSGDESADLNVTGDESAALEASAGATALLSAGETTMVVTRDYNALSNHPTIEGTELVGDLSLSDISAYTKTEVDALVGSAVTVDTSLTKTSTNPVTSKALYKTVGQLIGNSAMMADVTVRKGMSINSYQYSSSDTDGVYYSGAFGIEAGDGIAISQPSQNVVTNGINLSIAVDADSTPTEDSAKPVTSGGAYTALAGKADKSSAGTLFFGAVDSTSTKTAFTATISGITEYHDGLAVMLKNGVVTSASGFTINVNGLGALPVYNNMAAATRDTTIFNINYTMLFIYDSDRVTGGCWICFRGYDSNSNYYDRMVWGYAVLDTAAASGRYSLGFMTASGDFVGMAQTSSTGTSKTLNTSVEIDPNLCFYQLTTTYAASKTVAASALYSRFNSVDIRYSCNQGSWMTARQPVYIKLSMADSGYFTFDSTPFTHTLPTSADGYYYKFIGIAYDTYRLVFEPKETLYYHDGTKLCRY